MTPAEFQQTLKNAGYDPVWVDGLWGSKTANACAAWFDGGKDIVVVEIPDDDVQVTSPDGQDFIAGWEGERLTSYQDSGGTWTVGIGHTSAAGPPTVTAGMTISEAESREIFTRDLAKFEKRVRDEFGPIPQEVFDGAVSFDFNTGAIDSASWPDLWRIGEYAESENKLKEWNQAGGQVNNGLVKRRDAEADMIFRQNYSGRP